MAKDSYETFTLQWSERVIEVGYQANWLNSDQWHIELRCADRLPVTETGYRSHFVPMEALCEEDIQTFVTAWMDRAAEDPSWQRYLEDSRQLKLF